MRLPLTPEMKKIWNEIEPYLIQDSNGLNIADDAPQEIKDLNKEFDRLIKEQSDFAESLEM
jgi:hypothetical protein